MTNTPTTRLGTATDISTAYADGGDLLAGLLAMPRIERAWTEPESPGPAPEFAALLARPMGARVEPAPVAPAPRFEAFPEVAPLRPVPMPSAAPAAPRPGRVLRTAPPRASVSGDAHGAFDSLLADSIANLPANRRLGLCKVCGQAKGICAIGPFWGD